MDTFKDISITLPREKIRDQIFYSTSKNWPRYNHTVELDSNGNQFLRQLSCSTKNNKTVINYDLTAQTIKLQQKLNQKNELLIKQSKWKNYYFKEEIYVLIQDILEYLNLIGSEVQENKQFHKYVKKLEKIIAKVQVKKKTQKNWIQLLGISSSQNLDTDFHSKSVQTQQTANQLLLTSIQFSVLQNQIISLKEQNKSLLKNLNIVTQQIENKQKEIINWQQKYSKLKSKREKLKHQYNHLQVKFQEFLIRKESLNDDLQKTENFSKRKLHKNATHFHTYSLDRNQISQKSKFAIHSQQNGQKIEQQSSNLFVLSDTPFIHEKNRQIPISTGFIETRKKLLMREKQVPENNSRKSISIMTNKSGQKTISLMQKKHSQKSEISKQNKTQNEKLDSVQIDQCQLPTNSLISETQQSQMDVWRQMLLSQAITIENLLDRI